MRLGAFIKEEYHSPEEWARKHVEREYGAAYWPQDIAYTADEATIEAYVEAARRHGLVIAEVGAWCNLLDPNPEVRQANFKRVVGQLKLADRVHARCCVNIFGTYNPNRWDGAHPENLTDRAFCEGVEVIQGILDAAKPKNTYYTVEPLPFIYPNDVSSMRRMIKAVNRPGFAVHVDMCNLVNSAERVYRTGDLTREFFAEFGPMIRSVHAKDTVLSDSLTLHIAEAIPGQGVFDHEALLRECARLDPDLPVLAEHLDTAEEYKQATDFLKQKAFELELEFVKGH